MFFVNLRKAVILASLSRTTLIASMNGKQHMWTENRAAIENPASFNHHLSQLSFREPFLRATDSFYDYYSLGFSMQPLQNSQPASIIYLDPQSSPPLPRTWNSESYERPLQSSSPTDLFQHDHTSSISVQEDVHTSEQQNWSLDNDLQRVVLSSSNQGKWKAKVTGEGRPRHISEEYSEWTKSKGPSEIFQNLDRLYSLHSLLDSTKDNVKVRAMWAKRLRRLANEKISQDLMSNDPLRHQMAIDALSTRRHACSPSLKIGERSALAKKLNKYWQLKKDQSAYLRFNRQVRKHPQSIDMARSSDEDVVRMAADMLTPRSYTMFQDDQDLERVDQSSSKGANRVVSASVSADEDDEPGEQASDSQEDYLKYLVD